MTHTATPWQVSGIRAKAAVGGVMTDGHQIGPDSDPVALVYYSGRTPDLHRETFGNASFIVKAVNNHEPLTAQLAEAVALLDGLLGLERGSGQRALDFVERYRTDLIAPRD